ncbi:Pr6Pr family membrane protein [Demequina sp. NBRC 110054]|uniref:Pr6Pr family membrane protein n=1 Tax=Demequina sp. NBRC 110054 TaxID=1570343 RepID=UPI0013564D10|nr:Pr6Pr family membrane protein [Demequina sp. NBRC 110054]
MRGVWTRVQLAGALLIFAALAATTLAVIESGTPSVLHLYGHFTIQANILAMATLLLSALRGSAAGSPRLESARLAATAHLFLLVVIYWTMLAHAGFALPDLWTNAVLHGLSAAILLTDWLVKGPRRALSWRHAWVVIAYPTAYLLTALVLGATCGWIPYPFLDPAGGYASVLATSAGMLAACWGVGMLLSQLTRWRPLTPTRETGA